MRIAYYSHYFTPEIGAPSARIHDLARQWLALGHEVEVVTCYPNHPTGKLYPGYKPSLRMREMVDGIEVYRNWTYVTPNKGFLKKTIGHVSFWPSALLLSNRRLPKPDVAIGTSPTLFAAMAALAFSRRRGIPFVMEVRDLWPAVFVDLGVLHEVHVNGSQIRLSLTLTSPSCPLGEQIRLEATRRVAALKGVTKVEVAEVWDPPWSPERMSPAARDALGSR